MRQGDNTRFGAYLTEVAADFPMLSEDWLRMLAAARMADDDRVADGGSVWVDVESDGLQTAGTA